MPESFSVAVKTNEIFVHVFGTGPRLLIAFHGFKESGKDFSAFENVLGEAYTIYAPDLPYSGYTTWNNFYFDTGDLKYLIHQLLLHAGREKFTLLGYSMGGRVALCAISPFILQMEALVLLAPDGLKVNPWYFFVTQTKLGHGLFNFVTYRPGLFHFIIEAGHKLGLTNDSIYKFAKLHTEEEGQRVLVYKVWTCLRRLYPDIHKVREDMITNMLPAILFFGKYDRIFPPDYGNIFEDIPSVEILAVNSGHQLLKREVGEEIFRYLGQNNH